jgi:hypothetical protein
VVHLFEEGSADGEFAVGGGVEVRWVYSRGELKKEARKGVPSPLALSLPQTQLKRLGVGSALMVAEARERFLTDHVDDVPLLAVKAASSAHVRSAPNQGAWLLCNPARSPLSSS